jgi:hypothetical protein
MSTDLQDLLREGLDRLTADVSVPDGLVGRAQGHNRQRRIRVRAAIAAGTAVAAAAAAVTVSLAATGNKPSNAPVRTQTIADVATRTERALAAAANQGNAIQVIRQSNSGAPFTLQPLGMGGSLEHPPPNPVLPRVLSNVTAQYLTSWTYHGLYLQEGISAAGRLVFVNSIGGLTRRLSGENYGAAYPLRVSWRTVTRGTSGLGPAPPMSCQQVAPSQYPSWQATISKSLSCGLYYLSGRQWVDGVDAMTLVSRPRFGGGLFRSTIWVNPATYLPVRTSLVTLSGPGRGQHLVNDFRFLPPTKANLAALHAAVRRAAIPATFRRLHLNVLLLAGAGGV